MDEILAVGSTGDADFFSVLRDVYSWRATKKEFKQITFMLSGIFNPRNLIEDDKISPFNVAHTINLPDFTVPQVCEMINKVKSIDNHNTRSLARHIYYWTEGQPYLTQLLCSYLTTKTSSVDVDIAVQELLHKDTVHLLPIIERLEEKKSQREYLKGILENKQIKFNPSHNELQMQLRLLGIIKSDNDGNCIIRNRIYKKALGGFKNKEFSDEENTNLS